LPSESDFYEFVMLNIKTKNDGVLFKIHVQPRASTNAVAGLYDDALKIRLTAPPIDGAANKMCINFLSKQLGITKSSIEIVAGQTSRTKHIFIRCADDSPIENQTQILIHKIEKLIMLKKS